jgi:hypothetical protein
VSGNGDEQRLDARDPLPLGTWTHLAVTLSGMTGTLYVNGTAVATNTSMTLNPSSLPVTTNDYVGKSQFPPDPSLDATVDEFQIWNSGLSAAQVQSLLTSAAGTTGGGNVVWYRFDEAWRTPATSACPSFPARSTGSRSSPRPSPGLAAARRSPSAWNPRTGHSLTPRRRCAA